MTTDTEKRHNRIGIFIILFTVFFLILTCAQNWVSLAINGQLPKPTMTTEDLIIEISDFHKLDYTLIKAIVRVESGGIVTATRFEPAVYQRTAAKDDFERRAMATSHGLMQVMGFNAKSCGLEWFELYDARNNLTCGMKILKDCLNRHKNDVTKALGCYNGNLEVYPNKVKVALADIILKRS